MGRGGAAGGGQRWWKRQWLLGVLEAPLAPDISAGLLGSKKKASRQELMMEPSSPGEEPKGSFAKALALTLLSSPFLEPLTRGCDRSHFSFPHR